MDFDFGSFEPDYSSYEPDYSSYEPDNTFDNSHLDMIYDDQYDQMMANYQDNSYSYEAPRYRPLYVPPNNRVQENQQSMREVSNNQNSRLQQAYTRPQRETYTLNSIEDIRGRNLRGIDLRPFAGVLNFVQADMTNIDLRGANVSGFDFSGADFTHAKSVVGVDFRNCNLSFANFSGMNLNWCNFSGLNMNNVQMHRVNAEKSQFIGARISNSGMSHSSFKDSQFQNARISETDMSYSNYKCANMENTNIEHSNLNHGRYRQAKMMNLNISDSTFNNSKCIGVDIHGLRFHKVEVKNLIMRNRIGLWPATYFRMLKAIKADKRENW